MLACEERNGLACFFNGAFRSCVVGWAKEAARLVAQFRAEMSAHAGDPGFAAVVDRMHRLSPDFAEMWARHDVQPGGFVAKTFDHPAVGRLQFEITQLRVPERPDLTLVLDSPADADTAAKIETLLDEHRRRHGMHVAQAAI
jgi:MmyB-like transcription regulator ligand binding domain